MKSKNLKKDKLANLLQRISDDTFKNFKTCPVLKDIEDTLIVRAENGLRHYRIQIGTLTQATAEMIEAWAEEEGFSPEIEYKEETRTRHISEREYQAILISW